MNIYTYISSLFKGSPKTAGKAQVDGVIESYADIGRKTRKQIFHHHTNGSDIPALILTATTGIIGEGISIQSRIKDENIAQEFEELIIEHSKKKNFEVSKRFSRDDALIMSISEKMRKGGILVRHRYSNNWEIPYKLEFIGVDMIDVGKYDPNRNILNGLGKDKYGAIISYFIYKDDSRIDSIEVPAKDISAYMDIWMDISQYTAVSRLSQMLPDLDGILEYQRNELLSAKDRSQAAVFWKTKLYDTVMDSINALYSKLKTSQKEVTADNFAELTDMQRSIMNKLSAEGVTPAGGMKAIPSEDEIIQVDSKTSTTYEPFSENNMNKITASQNRSRVITYKDMKNTNWATINALSSIDEKQNATEMRMIREHILDDYLERLFFIGVQTKRINLSFVKYRKEKHLYHKWEVLRQSRVVTDETKIATANAKNLENELVTKEEIYAKKGKDYKTEILKQHRTEIELRKEIDKMYEDNKMKSPYELAEAEEQAQQENQKIRTALAETLGVNNG